MKIIIRTLIIVLFISTLIPYFTGDSKGMLIPYGLMEIGIIYELVQGNAGILEFLLLLVLLAIQIPIISLLSIPSKKKFKLRPIIFLVGFMIINFANLKFKNWDQAFISLIPFILIWLILLFLVQRFYRQNQSKNVELSQV
ncbi:hypothetical protein [Winogradskyella aurantiaca]|uniref:hypothetical protein n=1 Tax=Winogradskyella aurantiaca TaxID=2219558 RepID=UPI000E1D8FFD|nr:hypothetical protein [Winogradskyella aurantiaca]